MSDLVLDEDSDNELIISEHSKIYTEQSDPEIDGLYNRYKRGKLDIQPDFQRNFVWDLKKSSILIESVLLDIPLPMVYLSEENDSRICVIDGQQRLTSFFSFIDGIFPNTHNIFKLSGLKVLTEFNNKPFSELPEEIQDKIRYSKIRTITFKKESDPNLKFEIFERLNTGSIALNNQELRNCIYRGPYNKLLQDLANDKDFLYLLGLEQSDKRMKDIELVLRFSTFYHQSYINYKPPIKSFLNNESLKYQYINDKDAEQLRKAFKNAISIIKSLFDNKAFKRLYRGTKNNPNGNWETKRFNTSLYDVYMDYFARADKNVVFSHLDQIREAIIDLMTTNDEFIESIEIGTSEERRVKKRFDLFRTTIDRIIENQSKQPRCFSFEIKEDLFTTNSSCALCGNQILNIDDAAVDHIHQYWLGGQTIPENARLTHKYCNAIRPRIE